MKAREPRSDIATQKQRRHPGIKVYFGGRSSPISQPITSSALRGSSRSHCSHRSERGPLSPGANARRISEPHCGHLMALGVCSMAAIILNTRKRGVHAKNQRPWDRVFLPAFVHRKAATTLA
jgi:hypothetical protein